MTPSRPRLGLSWLGLGPSWRHLGAVLGRLGAIDGAQMVQVGLKDDFGASLGVFFDCIFKLCRRVFKGDNLDRYVEHIV